MNIRKEAIDGKAIFIVDDFLDKSDADSFYSFVSGLRFSKKERDFDGDEYPIFSIDFIPEKFEQDSTIGKAGRHLLEHVAGIKGLELYRSYINMSHYGDMEFPHRDCGIDESDVTVLYYINPAWDYRWGGETMFYEQKQTKIAVLPAPGRFVIFPGAVEHIGSIPTRICTTSRFSLALKYRPGITSPSNDSQ